MSARPLEPLPVQAQPQADECGLGFLLRTATLNGMGLSALQHWAQVPSLWEMATQEIERLALVTQVHPSWLAHRVMVRDRSVRRKQYSLLGWDWAGVPVLRRSRPQVCPECLAEQTYCRAAWSATGMLACPRHERLLIDCCRHCAHPLSWLRPAVDICQCGRYLSRGQDPGEVDDVTKAWCRALSSRLHPERIGAAEPWVGIPAWFEHLSPDGMFRVIHAFGVMDHPHRPPTSAQVVRTPAANEVQTWLLQAVGRLRTLDTAPADEVVTELAPWVYELGLTRLAERGTREPDRQAARLLLSRLQRPKRQGGRQGGPRRQGQLELFGSGHA